MQNDDLENIDAAPAAPPGAAEKATFSAVPLTDISPSSLLDGATPLDSQEDVQHTLETEQQQAAVYSPVVVSPEQTPDQFAAALEPSGNIARSRAPGVLQSLRQDKQQLANSKSGEEQGLQEEHSVRPKFVGKFTFTAAPNVPMAKKVQRKNFSHSEARLREIKRENKMMVDRLAHVGTSQTHTPLPPAPAASAGVNRRKAADNINEENYAIFRRLQAVQPSKEMRREQLELEFKANQQYVHNASHYRSATSSTV